MVKINLKKQTTGTFPMLLPIRPVHLLPDIASVRQQKSSLRRPNQRRHLLMPYHIPRAGIGPLITGAAGRWLAHIDHVFGCRRALSWQTIGGHEAGHTDVTGRSGGATWTKAEGGAETWHSTLPPSSKRLFDQFWFGLGVDAPEAALPGLFLAAGYLGDK